MSASEHPIGRLQDRVALVTGGASGIGKAIAECFAEEGAKVLIADINAEGGQQVVAAIQAQGGQARFVATDVTKSDDCERMVVEAVTHLGPLDIMVNNAGIGQGGAIAELPESVWDAVMAVNLKGVFLGTKYAFRAMLNRGGVILNMASVAGLTSPPGFAAYGTAKAGVIQLTKITAREGAAVGIRANALCPVWVETPLVEAFLNQSPNPEAAKREMIGSIPLGRMGTPQDVAEAALYLASDAGAFLTGVILPIDGGLLVGPSGGMTSRRPARKQEAPAKEV